MLLLRSTDRRMDVPHRKPSNGDLDMTRKGNVRTLFHLARPARLTMCRAGDYFFTLAFARLAGAEALPSARTFVSA
jgi:hypothetical protein